MPTDITKKTVFTTFEAAKLCSANITSIKNWIEQGEIEAFRTPGGHYRIERQSLAAFLDKHNMPNPLARSTKGVLAIHSNVSLMSRIAGSLGDGYDMVTTSDPVEGLIRLGHMKPRAVVVDASIEGADPILICRSVSAKQELGQVDVVVCEIEDEHTASKVREAGAHTVVTRGENDLMLVNALLAALSI